MEGKFSGKVVVEQLGLRLEITESEDRVDKRKQSIRKQFRSYRADQVVMWKVPKDILPEDHLVWFVLDLVANLDLSELYCNYRTGDGRGQPPYDPAMMAALLIYGYCTDRESGRGLEKATYDDIACRIITGDQHPDHSKICDFRKQHLGALDKLFEQVIKVAQEAGLVPLRNVATDGTKVKANASKHKAMSYERMGEYEAKWEKEIPEIRAQIDAGEKANPPLPQSKLEELHKDLAIREKRLPVIKASKAALEQEARERAAKERAADEKRAAEQGKTPRRRVYRTAPKPKAQRNFTDSDSKIMPWKKTFVQGYNAQIAVDGHAQIVVGNYVAQAANDKQELLPMARQINKRFGCLPDNFLADSGFFSEANLTAEEWETLGVTNLYIPPGKEEKGRKASAPVGRIPKDASIAERMRRKLKTKAGHNIYRLRKSIVEPAIGQIKCALNFDEFRLRGLKQVQHEWSFICTIHNILKIFRSGFQFAPDTG